MTDGYGPSLFASLEKSDPPGSSLKTSAGSCLSRNPSVSFEGWRDRVTKFGLSYSEPVMSALPTEGIASGSSGGGWMTPSRTDSPTGKAYTLDGGDPEKPRPSLLGQAREWPTPQKWDGERGAESRATKQARGSGGVNLAQAAMDWPTPTAAEADKIGGQANYGQVGLNNHPAIRGEPTRPPGEKSRAGPPDPASRSTGGKSRDWCTPGASLGTAGNKSRSGSRIGEPLLAGQAQQSEESSATISSVTSPPSGARPSTGSLNPRWVAQLQGFPADWLDGVEPPSKRSGTRSSRR